MIYLIAGIVLVCAEMFVGSFWLFVIGVASLIMAGLVTTFPSMGFVSQSIAMVILGFLVPVVVKRVKGFTKLPQTNLNQPLSRYIGQFCHAENEFESGRGRVIMAETTWNAVSEGGGSYNAGQKFEVVAAGGDGVLVVRAIV